MGKKRKGICIALAGICVLAAYGGRILAVNQKWENAPVEYYQKTEEVYMEKDILMDFTMEGYSAAVNEAQVMDYSEFLEKYNGKDEYSNVPEKVYDISVTIRNADAEDTTGINLTDFYIQGVAACESINMDLYHIANPQLANTYAIALRKNSEIELHLPFNLWEVNFRKKTWENLTDYPMFLVVTLYPVKKMISLTE